MTLSIMSVLATNVAMVTLFTGFYVDFGTCDQKVSHLARVLEYIRLFRAETYSVKYANFVYIYWIKLLHKTKMFNYWD